MKIIRAGKVELKTDFNIWSSFGLVLEEDGHASLQGWSGKNNRTSQLDFVKQCREELDKYIDHLENGTIFEDHKWYEFWKKTK